MTVAYLVTWMMVFLRAVGVVLLMPEFAGRTPPIMARVGLMACLATLIAGIVPSAEVPDTQWHLGTMAAGEVLLGLALGYVSRLTFSAMEFAGRLIASEVGISAAPGFGAPAMGSESLASFLSSLAVILFFIFGGHLSAITAFTRSFSIAHPGHPSISPAAVTEVVRLTGRLIELGVRIAAPFIALNFLVTLAFSALGRAVPRMQVFVMSGSVRAAVGIALLAGAGTLIGRYLYAEFYRMPTDMLGLVGGR